MKRLLLFILLCCSTLVNGQTQAYEIKLNFTYKVDRNVKNSTSSNMTINLDYSDGSSEQIYYNPIGDNTYQSPTNLVLVRNKKPTRFHVTGFVNFSHTGNADWDHNLDLNEGCLSETRFTYNHSGFSNDRIDFDYSSRPILNLLQPTNTLIGFDDNFTVSVNNNSSGFPTAFYNWQYQTVSSGTPSSSGWINMPTSANGQSSLSITPSSFLNSNDIGKRIYFRIKTCNDLVSENAVFYDLRLSSPHISSNNATPVACFDSDDGYVKINFDRALTSGELLSISLTNTTTGNDYSISSISSLETDNSYTIENLPTGNYTARLLGTAPGYNGSLFNTYTDGAMHSTAFAINKPTPVAFSTSKINVWCNGGSDGQISLNSSGGTGSYEYQIDGGIWASFTNTNTHAITGLSPGTYKVKVRDANGCVAKEIVRDGSGTVVGLGNEITETIEITEPNTPVAVAFVYYKEPTAFGFSDGRIRAQITGGTPLADGRYNYTWTHTNGTTWTTFSDVVDPADGWFLTLENAIAGTYTLTVTDANYSSATDTAGCTIASAEFTLNEPPLLELSLTETHAISCNNTNTYANESSDGELTITATGGVPLQPSANNGLLYYYTWKKETSPGVWAVLTDQTTNIASNLDTGNYAVNIEDANGIIIGTYTNNVLVNPTDELYTLNQPDLLQISLTKTNLFCANGNDATSTVSITGGTAPYTIQWSNGDTTETATNLIAGNYIAYVTDARGCQASGNITIDQPGGLTIDVVQQINPTCFEGNDGKIELALSGGTPPYTYSWSTGASNTTINALTEGIYTFALTDANGCKAFKEVILKNPDKITIDLGDDRTLCKDQAYELDGSITDPNATYLWTSNNGFSATTPQISISQAGTYQVTATSSLGCTATDTIVLSYSDTEIDSEFLLSSQAYVDEDVILFNVSNPLGDTSRWNIPNNVTIIDQTHTSITLHFPKADTYKIGLVSTQGNCYQEIYKNIVVEEQTGLPDPGDTKTPFIKEFRLTPNPTNGQFEVYINLAEPSAVALRVFDIQGGFIFAQPALQTAEEYTVPFRLNLSEGVYFVVLETAKETQIKRMVVL